MHIVDDEKGESVICWKTVLSLPPKQKEAHFVFLSNKPSALQRTGEGSEILERGVSRIFEQANKRIYG